jgi:predicted metal-dependent hydrolase
MYGMKNPYMAEGGQPRINQEQAVVQQLIQAFAQLSPQGQQMFIEGVQQMMEQTQGQSGEQEQGVPPEQMQQEQQMMQEQQMQRMGGYNNAGFRNLPLSVQQKIMRNS